MKGGTSLYLDIVRFSAAMVVFSEHVREHTRGSLHDFWGRHPFWYTHSFLYSQMAVIVFFALSGYVIAHVLTTRERDPVLFAASRLARLYSVVLPALLLTVVTNHFEEARYPAAFQDFNALGDAGMALHYAGTALFANRFWLWQNLEPPNIHAIWSLGFEAVYYAGIGLFVFARGLPRVAALLALGLVAGPSIVLLAPAWLFGYAAYHLTRRVDLAPPLAGLLWLGSGALLVACPLLEPSVRPALPYLRMPDPSLEGLLASYAEALCFAVNILAFGALADRAAPLLSPLSVPIRWLGSLTFALYLFHEPLILFVTAMTPVEARGWPLHVPLMIVGILLAVATAGRACEQSKEWWRRGLLSLWGGLSGSGKTPRFARSDRDFSCHPERSEE